jgi:hypothetical protein
MQALITSSADLNKLGVLPQQAINTKKPGQLLAHLDHSWCV